MHLLSHIRRLDRTTKMSWSSQGSMGASFGRVLAELDIALEVDALPGGQEHGELLMRNGEFAEATDAEPPQSSFLG